MPSHAKSHKLMKLHGNISETVVSSSVLRCQFLSRSLIIMAKSVVPSLVPCGTPPWVWVQGDRELPILTAWVRFVRTNYNILLNVSLGRLPVQAHSLNILLTVNLQFKP